MPLLQGKVSMDRIGRHTHARLKPAIRGIDSHEDRVSPVLICVQIHTLTLSLSFSLLHTDFLPHVVKLLPEILVFSLI